MPKILTQQPPWIARGTPGHQLFQHDEPAKPSSAPKNAQYDGPLRKVAHRGTEVFVAVGNELRWADVSALERPAPDEQEDDRGQYRVLKTSLSRPIQQLSVSRSGDFIAILTSHTCHVAPLPASSHLYSGDLSPLRLKTLQVGPTAHVLEQAPLMSAIWHPLSPSGNCLVTVTQDACVRLWELDSNNRSTFDEPSLAIDLKKLANATSTQIDFSASKYGVSTGFSPDNIEMQVAAACFGGQGRDDEHGWSSMTLWVAMGEGDVYSLCPLLPSKWRAPATMLPSLSTSVVAKVRAASGDSEITAAEKRVVDQQCTWLAELDNQDPMLQPREDEFDTVEVYSRPAKPGPIPKLQGPFYMSTELDSGDVTDICVIAAKIDDDAVYDDEFEETDAADGLSVGVICLATSNGKVHVCLDLDGVEAEWLPLKRPRSFTPDDDGEKDLLLFETIDLYGEDVGEGWPTFTASPVERYELFVTTQSGVYNLDFTYWTNMLEADLASDSDAGVDFRLKMLLESAKTAVSQIITVPAKPERNVNAVMAICDPASIGYVLLTAAANTPFATVLELPIHPSHAYAPDELTSAGALPAPEPRAPYEPAEAFYQASALPQLLKIASEKRLLGSDLKAQVRFSPATLQLMTDAHRAMSSETHRLGLAAADLFRRCERMQAELREQVRKVNEIAQKVDVVVGEETDAGSDNETAPRFSGKEKIERRIQQSEDKTRQLNEKVDVLRKKMMSLGGKQLSAKEQAFASEVETLNRSLQPAVAPEAPTEPATLLHMENSPSSKREHEQERADSLTGRFEAVRALRERLVRQVEDEAARKAEKETEGGEGKGGPMAMSGFRSRRMEQVRSLLERETALVEGVGERLARLSAGS
ncbi:hypothetical protein B0A55_05518 [Friedmanniomyces simplex]|uniref:Uncharacterized protein n=1 Tax=Friedmanniomyces simplex TaxID=329884 RepID=A0A4U0XC72_9PEZI|nr:hypothetical protein B0A55_05518 [Friedmanniomyces simplex]